MQRTFTVTLSFCFWLALIFSASAQTFLDGQRESLRGLKGVELVMEVINPEAERKGLTRSQLQTDVELRLRKAGIKVLTRQERLKTPGYPFLYVNVSTVKTPETLGGLLGGLYGYSISVELREKVILARNRSIETYAATWSKGVVGTVGADKLRSVREGVGDLVDEFINDYLAMNPRRGS